MKILDKIKKVFEPFFDPASKETPENHANEAVREAAKHLPQYIKEMSVPDLAREINKFKQPNKWAITRRASQGMQKSNFVGGNSYPKNISERNLKRRQRQIEKGMIQITPEREYKSSKKVEVTP